MAGETWPDQFGIDAREPPQGNATTLALRTNFAAISAALTARLAQATTDHAALLAVATYIAGLRYSNTTTIDLLKSTVEHSVAPMPLQLTMHPLWRSTIQWIDLGAYTHARFHGYAGSSANQVGAIFAPAYATTPSSDPQQWTIIDEMNIFMEATHPDSPFDTGWLPLPTSLPYSAYCTLVTQGGDNANPASLWSAQLDLRYIGPP